MMVMWFYGNALSEFPELATYYFQMGLTENLQRWFQLFKEDMDEAGELLLWITGDLAFHKLIRVGDLHKVMPIINSHLRSEEKHFTLESVVIIGQLIEVFEENE